jgi:preprotein translocase subunit Sss1
VNAWNEGARGTALEIRNFLPNATKALREAQRPAGERFLKSAPRAAREDIETVADLLGY